MSAPRSTTSQPLRPLAPPAARRRAGLAAVSATMLAQVGLAAVRPWPMKVLVDNVLHAKPLHGAAGDLFAALPGPATQNALLWWAAIATVVVFLLGWAAS